MIKKILLIIILVLLSSAVFAGTVIYFDAEKNLEVVDVSGQKTLGQINEEFKGKFADVTDERAKKIEAVELAQKEKAEQKEALKKQKEEKLRIKLNLSEQDWEDLKEVLK